METDQIDRPREFKKLLLASFISQSGSHFMTLAIAFTVYALSGGSMVKAALVMVFSYLPVIFLTKLAGSLIDRKLSVRMLLVFEASAAIVSVICGALVYFDQFIVLLPLLCARCLLTFATRAALSRWIKLISSLGKQGVRLKIFLLGFFLATTVAGILAILTLGIDLRPAIVNVVIIDVVTYLISMLVILSLKSLPETPLEIQKFATDEISASQEAFSDTLGQILQQPVLKKTFLRVVLSQALFQGAYLALIAVIADHFDLGLKAGAFFQISASIGLIIAFVVLWIFPLCMREKKDALPISTILVGFGGLLSIIGIAESGYFFPALLSFGVMTLFYELLWLANRESFFVATPAVSVARYQFLLDSVGATLMSICALGYAVFMELFGFQMGILSFLVVSFVFMMIIGIASKIRPKEIVF